MNHLHFQHSFTSVPVLHHPQAIKHQLCKIYTTSLLFLLKMCKKRNASVLCCYGNVCGAFFHFHYVTSRGFNYELPANANMLPMTIIFIAGRISTISIKHQNRQLKSACEDRFVSRWVSVFMLPTASAVSFIHLLATTFFWDTVTLFKKKKKNENMK